MALDLWRFVPLRRFFKGTIEKACSSQSGMAGTYKASLPLKTWVLAFGGALLRARLALDPRSLIRVVVFLFQTYVLA